MKQLVTSGIILSRTNYGEADRILTLLTPDYGKLRLVAKGVRRIKSKLAGGIELFSVSNITFVRGKGDLGTVISTRLQTHYRHIVEDIERTMLGYELIKRLNKNTEDGVEGEYFTLLEQVFVALDNRAIAPSITQCWFEAQLVRLAGHTPNLYTDNQNKALAAGQNYTFNFEQMGFVLAPEGSFGSDHIKFLRLLFGQTNPALLGRVGNGASLATECAPLVAHVYRLHMAQR